jgi:hypothetical protein
VATHPVEIGPVEARQGVAGHGVRYVLACGLVLAVLGMVLVLALAR